MNPALDLLKPYPFERLATLKKDINPNGQLKHISLSIGEPKNKPPEFVFDTIKTQRNYKQEQSSMIHVAKNANNADIWICDWRRKSVSV